jgi:cytochrome P450
MLEGQLVLATIAQRYRLSRRGKPTKAEALVTLRPKGEVWMDVERSAFAAKADL